MDEFVVFVQSNPWIIIIIIIVLIIVEIEDNNIDGDK